MTIKMKVLSGVLVLIILVLGLFIASLAGQVKAYEDLEKIYLKAACQDKDAFLRVLTETDLSGINSRLTLTSIDPEEVKPRWIIHHMNKCDQPIVPKL